MTGNVLTAAVLGCFAALIAAPAAAQSEVTVSKRSCKKLVRSHVAGADYVPGVDVHGRKVAPADLGGGSRIKLPKEINIDIGIDLEEKYGLGAGGDYEGKAKIGTVTVKGTRVYWNGELLGDSEQHAIAEECQRIYGKK